MNLRIKELIDNSRLVGLDTDTAKQISLWEYKYPYDAYSFKGRENGYLWNKETWGTEQFCLLCKEIITGQVACQWEQGELWIGWSMAPAICGQGCGTVFVRKCIGEIREHFNYQDKLLLRVAASNMRAVKAYQKAGFQYIKTVKDEIAYSDNIEDFWIMELDSI